MRGKEIYGSLKVVLPKTAVSISDRILARYRMDALREFGKSAGEDRPDFLGI